MTTLLRVRQRQYAFVTGASEYRDLVTRNVLVCTVLYGIDQKSGVAFLSHFDFPWSAWHLPRIISEAREKVGDDHDFQFEIINGSLWVSILYFCSAFLTRYILRRGLANLGYLDSTTDNKFSVCKLRRSVRYISAKKKINITSYCIHRGQLDGPISKSMGKANGSA